MADNKSKKISLVNKQDLASIAKTGDIPKDNTEKDKKENLYISMKPREQTESKETTSPSNNINVLLVKDSNRRKVSYSPNIIKKYADMQKRGEMPEGVSIAEEPVGKYLEKQFSKYKVDFEKAIQSRDNKNLELVALYITRANESNDKVALGIMIELIKNDPNYAFAFDGGRLDLNKLKGLSLMSEVDVKVGFDKAEELEDLTNGKFDSTKKTAEQIDKIADQDISQRIETETQETENSLDVEIDNAETEKDVENTTSTVKEKLSIGIATMVASLGAIKNISARQNAEKRINNAKLKTEQKIDSKAKEGLSKLGNLRKTAENSKDSNSIENLFKRSSLSETSKESENKQLEDRARLEREKIDKEQELQRIRNRKEAGKKITPEEEALLREETIRIAEQKMRDNNTIQQYRAEESIVRQTVEVGRESAERQERANKDGQRQVVVVGEDGPEL